MFESTTLYQRLHALKTPHRLLVAYSGGVDSHVLLHALAHLSTQHPELQLRAAHIHHQLNPGADHWEQHCQKICIQLGIELIIKRIDISVHLENKQSLEEAARELRYQALEEILRPSEALLTAHHLNDQAETVLLQLLRGAGVKGLSAMPMHKVFGKGVLVRPLLDITRASILEYAQQHKLLWIEDDSNVALNFDRNYLRHQILPLIAQRWSGVGQVLARVASHCANTSELLEVLAEQDLSQVKGITANTLSIHALKQLSQSRQINVIRFWLRKLNFQIPSTKQMQQLLQDIIDAAVDAQPMMQWKETQIRRYQDFLYALRPQVEPAKHTFIWQLPQALSLPGWGTLTQDHLTELGLQLPENVTLRVGFRQGGERFQPLDRCGSHPLKKLFQEWKIPPWLRSRIPLIFWKEELIAVVGYARSHKAIPIQLIHSAPSG